jgi:hypothetical protein
MFPELRIERKVDVAVPAEDEPTANSVVGACRAKSPPVNRENVAYGDVEPIATAPLNVDVAVVDVANKFPTVNCVPVADRAPDPLDVMTELIGNVPVVVMNPASLLNQDNLTDEEAIVLA